MQHELYYTVIENEYSSITNYSYYVEETLQDIIEFYYLQKYNKQYLELGWWLEDGAKDFVKNIEQQWWHNKINTVCLYADYDFIDFLKTKYYDDAVEQAEKDGDLSSTSIDPYEPNPEDYDTYEEYLEAIDNYHENDWDN
jgi:hypothetical protein